MKAAKLKGPGNVVIEDIPYPTLGPNDVIVRNIIGGLCGTDISAYKFGGQVAGISPDDEFGHEFAGEVEAVGEAVKGIEPGMRVSVNPSLAKKEGTIRCCMCGGFSEYVLVENAALGYNVFEIPENVSYDEAAIIEPYSVATHGVDAIHPKKTDNILIFGAGTIGLCALASLKSQGVNNVIVSDVVDFRLNKVRELGGIPVNVANTNLRKFLIEHFGTVQTDYGPRTNTDAFIDCAGTPNVIPDIFDLCKVNSRVSIVALHPEPKMISLLLVMIYQLTIVGSCAYDIPTFEKVIGFLANKTTNLPEVIGTHHFRLDEITEAFKTSMKADEAVKVFIDY